MPSLFFWENGEVVLYDKTRIIIGYDIHGIYLDVNGEYVGIIDKPANAFSVLHFKKLNSIKYIPANNKLHISIDISF